MMGLHGTRRDTESRRQKFRREKEFARMIINHWQPWFIEHFGGSFPKSYFTYDVESSGFSRKEDMILEWGHCLVRDGEIVDRNNVVINWFKCPESISAAQLRFKLDRVAQSMRENAKPWRLTEAV